MLAARSARVKTKSKKHLVAKKVNDNVATAATKQLQVFTSRLGVSDKATIYMYDKRAYINARFVLPVLSVDIKKFKKSSGKLHYIMIKSEVYVSKYGLTRLLAASEEQAAYMLQDYIFEVIYKLETTGSVKIEDVDSRKKLCEQAAQLELYEIADATNKQTAHDVADRFRALNSDYAIVTNENEKLKRQLSDISDELDIATRDYRQLYKQAKKLARYVRFNSSNLIAEVDLLDSSGDELDEDVVNLERIKSDGMRAKRVVNRYNTKGKTRRSKPVTVSKKTLYYVMQGTFSYGRPRGHRIYSWKIVDKLPNNDDILTVNEHKYNSFKEFSEDYRLGGVKQIEYDYIWYSDLYIPEANCEILKKLTSMLQYVDNESYMQITEIFN